MKIFTLNEKKVLEGAEVKNFRLSCGVEIPAILVGEDGRGRRLGVLPVKGVSLDEAGNATIENGAVILSQTNKPMLQLLKQEDDLDTSSCILVIKPTLSFRGFDKIWLNDIKIEGWEKELPEWLLSIGVVADGDAGRMGSCPQAVLVARKGDIIEVNHKGRTYGEPKKIFYKLINGFPVVATEAEREILGW